MLPIGGFTGTIPSPIPAQLQTGLQDRRFHLVIAFSTRDPRLAWIAQHCLRSRPDVYSWFPGRA